MRLVKLITKKGKDVYVNPEKVTHLYEKETFVKVFFDNSGEKQNSILVKGDLSHVSELLTRI